MVDINMIYKSNSDYLKAEDIGNMMPTYTIQAADLKEFDNGDRKLVLSFLETDKTMPLNITNARAIADLYGHDSNGWVNRKIMLFTMPVDYQGRMVQGLRVRAPQQFVTGTPNPNAPLNTAGDAGGDPRGNIPFPNSADDYGGVRG